MQGTAIIIFMILLRLAVPVGITFLLSFLYNRLAARWEREAQSSVAADTTINVFQEELLIEQCPIRERAIRAQCNRPGIPCWLALQLNEGHLPEACMNCERFKEILPRHVHPA